MSQQLRVVKQEKGANQKKQNSALCITSSMMSPNGTWIMTEMSWTASSLETTKKCNASLSKSSKEAAKELAAKRGKESSKRLQVQTYSQAT